MPVSSYVNQIFRKSAWEHWSNTAYLNKIMLTLNFFLLCSLLKQTEWLIMYYPARVTIYQLYNLEHHKNWYLIGEIISLSQTNVLNAFIGYSSFKCLNTSSLSHHCLLNVLYIVEMKKGRMVQYPIHTSWIQSLSSRTFFFLKITTALHFSAQQIQAIPAFGFLQ